MDQAAKIEKEITDITKRFKVWPKKWPRAFFFIMTVLIILPALICIMLAIKQKSAPMEIVITLILPTSIIFFWLKALSLLKLQ